MIMMIPDCVSSFFFFIVLRRSIFFFAAVVSLRGKFLQWLGGTKHHLQHARTHTKHSHSSVRE